MPFYEPPLCSPDKHAAEYSEAELAEFKTSFADNETRRLPRFAVLGCYVGIPLVVLTFTMAIRISEWLGAGERGFVFCIPILLITVWWFARASQSRCPACSHDVDHSVGFYCPCCGEKTLTTYGQQPTCRSCGATLKWDQFGSHRRQFRLQFCSMCGVKLSDEGV